MCGIPGEDEYWERRREERENEGHSEKIVHGMKTNQSTKMAICSWMVKLRRLKRNGAIRWKNCTKAICLR